MPGVIKTPPLYKCRRKSSLSARIRSVSEDMVVSVLMMLGWVARKVVADGKWLIRKVRAVVRTLLLTS